MLATLVAVNLTVAQWLLVIAVAFCLIIGVFNATRKPSLWAPVLWACALGFVAGGLFFLA
jgi:hypothetical protein